MNNQGSSSSEHTQKKGREYQRGPYRSATKRTDCDKDCIPLREEILQFRSSIRNKYTLSHNRSKILESCQNLIDYLTKQVNKKKEQESLDPLIRIQQLEKKVEDLTKIIEFQNNPLDFGSISELDLSRFPTE